MPNIKFTDRVRHWTPRYMWNRLKLGLFQWRNPDVPWLTAHAIRILDAWLRPGDVGLEFGSGRSTLWFANRITALTSVEHDHSWYQRISAQLELASIENVEYIFEALEDSAPSHQPSAYASVTKRFSNRSLDFVLVDGAARSECALMSLDKIKLGGILIIDNVNWALPSRSGSPASRSEIEGPASEEWALVLRRLGNWRCIWTTNGVTDTAIYFRSCS